MPPVATTTRACTAPGAPKFLIHRPDVSVMEGLLAAHGLDLTAVVLRLAWQLGLLRSEIHGLSWEQVDFTASLVRLADRAVPMDPEIQVFLQRLSTARDTVRGPVVLSDRGGRRPAEQHLSYVCRKALDAAGQTEVRLLDLRYDYILRQLERHDWQYVSRVSGLDIRTLQLHFAGSWNTRRRQTSSPVLDAQRIRAVEEAEGLSACGTAIRLVWRLGLRQEELQNLRWEMIDWEERLVRLPSRTVPLPSELTPFLLALRQQNGGQAPEVLLSDRARRPMESTYVSKLVRAALVRGGCDHVTLRDLRRDWELRTCFEGPLLRLLEQRGRLTRGDAMEQLGSSGSQANTCLRRMLQRGTLIRSGHCYYLPGAIVPPEQQEEALLAYLSNHPGCRRGQLAKLLGLSPKQSLTILQKLLKSGKIIRQGNCYQVAGR